MQPLEEVLQGLEKVADAELQNDERVVNERKIKLH